MKKLTILFKEVSVSAKPSLFQAFSVIILMATLVVGCASDIANSTENNQKENDTDQSKLMVFKTGEATTRTSIIHSVSGSATAYWEAGDNIWVDKEGTFVKSVSSDITGTVSSAKFYFTGSFPALSYPVYYTGQNSTAGNIVTIPAVQTQNVPNNTRHFGLSGDCGTGTATHFNGIFQFTLNHSATYLCFLPRAENTAVSNFVIRSIIVTAENDIAGNFSLSSTGLSSSPIDNASKSITLNVDNFPLTNTTTDPALNAAYMVIAPSATPTALNVTYTLYNPQTGLTGTVSKNIPAQVYAANKIYNITSKLVNDYSKERKLYMWDAKKDYYNGITDPYTGFLENLPYSTDPDKQPNDEFDYINYSTPAIAKSSCKDCPSPIQMLWYALTDPYWDANELWTADGRVFKGVMRLKKWSVILAEEEDARQGREPTPSSPDEEVYGLPIDEWTAHNSAPGQGLPAPSAMAKYFAVPGGEINNETKYWADRSIGTGMNQACYMGISPTKVWVSAWAGDIGFRHFIYRAIKFE